MQSPAANTPGRLVFIRRSTRMNAPSISSPGSSVESAAVSRKMNTPSNGKSSPPAFRPVAVLSPRIASGFWPQTVILSSSASSFCAEIDDLAAKPCQKVGFAHGFRSLRDDGDAFAAVEHAVACAAIADPASEQFAFAGEQLGLLCARAEDDTLSLDKIRAERKGERAAQRDNLMYDAGRSSAPKSCACFFMASSRSWPEISGRPG